MAEWVLVTESEFGTSLFVDPNIKKTGSMRMFWHIQNLKQADRQGDMSYPGSMATGQKSEEAYQPSDWIAIGSDTSSQAMLKYICSL